MTTTTTEPPPDVPLPKNHGCRFSWCENPNDKWESHRFEHFQAGEYIPASGKSLTGVVLGARHLYQEDLPTLGVGVRFNEDVDPAPTIFLDDPRGETDYVLRIDEAVLLYNALGTAIEKAVEGTHLSPAEITRFYSSEETK
jgi:hypothetical protein